MAKGLLLFLHAFMFQKCFWPGINGMDGDNCKLGLKAMRSMVDVVSKEKANSVIGHAQPQPFKCRSGTAYDADDTDGRRPTPRMGPPSVHR